VIAASFPAPTPWQLHLKIETPQLWPLGIIIWDFETCFGFMTEMPLLQYAFCKEWCNTGFAVALLILNQP